jgi:hypothetical protein
VLYSDMGFVENTGLYSDMGFVENTGLYSDIVLLYPDCEKYSKPCS